MSKMPVIPLISKPITRGEEIEKKFLIMGTPGEQFVSFGNQDQNTKLYTRTLTQGDLYITFYPPSPNWDKILKALKFSKSRVPFLIKTLRVRAIIPQNRLKEPRYILSFKGKNSADKTTQPELEYELLSNQFRLVSQLCNNICTIKKRYKWNPTGDLSWELDAFVDRFLFMAEVEVKDKKDFKKIKTDWLDVTKIDGFSGKDLAKYSKPLLIIR